MFGYVKINKPEMKVREYETYKGLYCSLCKALSKNFGILARFTLSYDITFLVIMRLSLKAAVPEFSSGRCPFNPMKRCNYCKSEDEELRYAAAMTMLMFYFKVRDNISDSGFFKRVLMYIILPWAKRKYKKAAELYPEVADIIAQAMEKQRQNETKDNTAVDSAAQQSAHALGKILAFEAEDESGNIYRLGYGVGKWVYLIDAFDDMEKDLESGSFNVFINKYNIKNKNDITQEIRNDIVGTLNMCGAFFGEAYNSLNLTGISVIAENIIFDGMYNVLDNIMNNTLKGKKEK